MSSPTISSGLKNTLPEPESFGLEGSLGSYDVVIQFHSAEVN